MNITENEIAAMRVCLNYDTRAAQLGDNYSNGSAADFMEELGGGRTTKPPPLSAA